MSMNPEIKAQWTAALRSGEYEQGQGSLRRDGKFCCLGVLCDQAVKAGIIPEPTQRDILDDLLYGQEKNSITLPAEVMEWAGVTDANPLVDAGILPEGVKWEVEPGDGANPALANLNDGGTPFAVIADIIDQQL